MILLFAVLWMDLEIIILSEDREKQTRYHLHVESKGKWYISTYLQNRNRVTDNKFTVTRRERGGEG